MSTKTFDQQLFSRTLGNCEIEFWATKEEFQYFCVDADRWLEILKEAGREGTWQICLHLHQERVTLSKDNVLVCLGPKDGAWVLLAEWANQEYLSYTRAEPFPKKAIVTLLTAFFSC
jgi:hypothetical protein